MHPTERAFLSIKAGDFTAVVGERQFISANGQCADEDAIVMIPVMVSFLERRIGDTPILRIDSDRHLTAWYVFGLAIFSSRGSAR